MHDVVHDVFLTRTIQSTDKPGRMANTEGSGIYFPVSDDVDVVGLNVLRCRADILRTIPVSGRSGWLCKSFRKMMTP